MLIILGLLLFCFIVNQGALRQTKWAALLIFAAALFVMGWRSVTYTEDNIAYASYFQLNSNLTLMDSWQNVIDGVGKDPFYYFLGNLFSKCGFSYRGWFVFISAVFLGGFCYLMYKRSKDFAFSMFLLVTLSYYYFAMTGLRQAIAFGFCYFAFEFLCRKKTLPFLLFVALGGLFHSSGWIFLLMYPLTFIPFGKKYILIILIAPVVAYLFPNLLGSLVKEVAWNEHLAGYGQATEGLTINGYVIECAIFFLCFFCLERSRWANGNGASIVSEEKQALSPQALANTNFLIYGMTALAWGVMFRAFSINIADFFRIAMYFSCLAPIVLPAFLDKLPVGEKRMAMCSIIVILMCRAFIGGHYEYFTMFEALPQFR